MSYCGIGLYHPQYSVNIGGVLRACYCFNASFLALESHKKFEKHGSDTPKAYRQIPVFRTQNLKELIPYDCVPIAVEIKENAKSLIEYHHPKRSFYIFGPENGTLGEKVLSYCKDVIYIPSKVCLNLAATVNIILYDRMAKK